CHCCCWSSWWCCWALPCPVSSRLTSRGCCTRASTSCALEVAIAAEPEEVTELFALLAGKGALLNTQADQQVQMQVQADDLFLDTVSQLKDDGYYLVTVVGNDERELENRRYKIYYVFSHPMIDLFVILEYLLDHDSVRYCSIQELFP